MIARLVAAAVIGGPLALLIVRAARAWWLFEIQRTGARPGPAGEPAPRARAEHRTGER